MNPERKIEPRKIHVLNIKTLKGNIEAPSESEVTEIASYRYTHSVGTGINEEEKLVGIQLTVEIETMNKNEELLAIKGSYTHEFTFWVENLDDFIDVNEDEQKDKSIDLDPLMGATLIGIAYSTIRGIVFTRTQGTSLNAIILPVIDPKELLATDTGRIDSD